MDQAITIKIDGTEYTVQEAKEIYGNLKLLFDREEVMYEYMSYDAHFLAGGIPSTAYEYDIQPFLEPELWL